MIADSAKTSMRHYAWFLVSNSAYDKYPAAVRYLSNRNVVQIVFYTI